MIASIAAVRLPTCSIRITHFPAIIMSHSFLRSLFLLLVITAPLSAQREDQRVSADYTTRELPEELRIQAAASTGSTTLAIWGANRPDGGDSAIGNLQMQRLHGSTPVGSPIQLHSDDARPSAFCAVVPFRERFLILWNDRRASSPGVYMRWVDTAGSFLTGEEIFSLDSIRTANGFKTFRTPEATLLIWQNGQSLKLRRLTPDGVFMEAERSLGAENITALWAPGGRNDLIVLQRDGRVLSLRSDGTFDPRPIPPARFDGTIVIGSDSTTSILRDSTIEIYRTVFDTIAIGTIRLPSHRGQSSAVLSLDTGGNYRIHYGAISTAWWGGSFTVDRVIASSSAVGPATLVDSIPFMVYDWNNTRSAFDAGKRVANCNGGTTVGFTGSLTTLGHYGNVSSESSLSWAFRITADGEYLRDMFPPASIPLCFDGEGTQPTVVRTRFTDTSVVRVEGNGVGSLLQAPIITRAYIDCQTRPNLVLYGGRLHVSWETRPLGWSDRNLRASEFVAAEWEPYSGKPAFNLSHLYPRVDYTGSGSSTSFASTFITLPGATIVTDQMTQNLTYPDRVTVVGASIYMMVDGWKKADDVSLYSGSMNWSVYPGNPNSKAVAGMTWGQGRYILWDKDAKRIQSLSAPTANAIVPIDSNRQIVITGTSAYLDSMGTKTRSFTLPAAGSSPVLYQRLFGSRYLRIIQMPGSWRLEVFPLYGPGGGLPFDSALYSRVLSPAADALAPFILQNPNDSSIVILWGSDNGVRLTRLDQYLRVAVSDSIVSATRDQVKTPAGVFRNDTLFVAWEDFRNVGSDIYATSWKAQRIVSPPPRSPSDSTVQPDPTAYPGQETAHNSVVIGAITPNPADRIATFFVELAEPGDAITEILDMTGQVLIRREKSFDMNSGRWDIDISDLGNGLYVLAVRTSKGAAMTKLVVIRE